MSLFPNRNEDDHFSLLHSHRYGRSTLYDRSPEDVEHHPPPPHYPHDTYDNSAHNRKEANDDVVVLDLGNAPATVLVGHIGSPSRIMEAEGEGEDYPLHPHFSGGHYYSSNNNNSSSGGGSRYFTSRASEGVGSNKSRTSSARRHARRRSTATGITNISSDDHLHSHQNPINMFYCSSSSSPSTLGRRSSGSGGGNKPYMGPATTTATTTTTAPTPAWEAIPDNEEHSSSPAEADVQRGLFGTNLSLAKPSWAAHPSAVMRDVFGLSSRQSTAQGASSSSPPPPPAPTMMPRPSGFPTHPTSHPSCTGVGAQHDGQEGEELLLLLQQCKANKKLRKKMHQKDLAKEKQRQERLAAHVLSETNAHKKQSARMKAALRRAQKNSARAQTISKRQERKGKQSKAKQLNNTARLFYFESGSDGESGDDDDIFFVFESDSERGSEEGDYGDEYRTTPHKKRKNRSGNKRGAKARASRARGRGMYADGEEPNEDAESDSDAFSSSSSDIIVGSTIFAPGDRTAHPARAASCHHNSKKGSLSDFERYRSAKEENDYDPNRGGLGGSGYDSRPRAYPMTYSAHPMNPTTTTASHHTNHNNNSGPTSSFFISPIHQSVAEETAPWSTLDTPQYQFLGFGGLSTAQRTGTRGGATPPASATTPPPPPPPPPLPLAASASAPATAVTGANQTAALQREARRAQEAYQLLSTGAGHLGGAPPPAFSFSLPDSSKGSKAMTAFQAKGRGMNLALPLSPTDRTGAPAPSSTTATADVAEQNARKHQRQRWRRERGEAEHASSEARDYCVRTSGYVYADDEAISNSSEDSDDWAEDDRMCCRRGGDGSREGGPRKQRKRMRRRAPESVMVQPKPSPAFMPAEADMLLLPSSKADLREDLLESYFTDAKLEDSDFNIYC